jgi:hypothetical protein
LLHVFTRKYDLRKDLSKYTYERKLQVAEKASAYYYTFYERIVHVKKSYQMYAKLVENLEPDTSLIEETIDMNSEWLGLLNDDKYIDINSVYLYFDLEHKDHFGEKDAGRLAEVQMEATLIKEKIDYWLNLFNEHIEDQDKAIEYYSNATELMEGLLTKLDEIIELITKHQESYRLNLNLIKEQMKRY